MSAAQPTAEGWDCHAHLFGPYDRFPLAPERRYTPPEAIESQYLALLARVASRTVCWCIPAPTAKTMRCCCAHWQLSPRCAAWRWCNRAVVSL